MATRKGYKLPTDKPVKKMALPAKPAVNAPPSKQKEYEKNLQIALKHNSAVEKELTRRKAVEDKAKAKKKK